jgi:hypothetical protein
MNLEESEWIKSANGDMLPNISPQVEKKVSFNELQNSKLQKIEISQSGSNAIPGTNSEDQKPPGIKKSCLKTFCGLADYCKRIPAEVPNEEYYHNSITIKLWRIIMAPGFEIMIFFTTIFT